MSTTVNEKTNRITSESLYYPCVAMVLPIESGKLSPEYVKRLTDHIEQEITSNYKRDKANFVINKLHDALSEIKYDGSKKSVAIFVSPIYKTVIHLDIPLEETIMVNEPFEIRDLVQRMEPSDKYLVLVESTQRFRVFLGGQDKLIKLKVNIPNNIAAYRNDIPEKIEYFSDVTDRKEIMMDKFIHHIDKELDAILNTYHLPVYIMGTERMNGHFRKLTHHEKSIREYIHGNYDDATPYQLNEILRPHLAEQKRSKAEDLSLKIEQALNANKLVYGIDEVWRNAMDKRGRTLIVENNYYYPHIVDEHGNLKSDAGTDNPSMLRDAVDVIIEKVLENGGEVKFADEGTLNDYQHIALIQYY